MKNWIVCDLDGTLCNEAHRSQFAGVEWDEYHKRCVDDTPFEDVIRVLDLLTSSIVPIGLMIITGRTEPYREVTRQWLDKHQVHPDVLFMRPVDNYEKATILKVSQLEGFFGSKEAALEKVLLCLDDSDRVVQAWRDYGLACWQVRSRS